MVVTFKSGEKVRFRSFAKLKYSLGLSIMKHTQEKEWSGTLSIPRSVCVCVCVQTVSERENPQLTHCEAPLLPIYCTRRNVMFGAHLLFLRGNRFPWGCEGLPEACLLTAPAGSPDGTPASRHQPLTCNIWGAAHLPTFSFQGWPFFLCI